ncbi:hypothetical protein COOONC_08389 [Cooperia oncophora]
MNSNEERQRESSSRELSDDGGVSLSDEEDLRARMDMHQLVSHGSISGDSPPQTADQVIEEIDEMLQQFNFHLDGTS